jgi:hypothetical protein
LPTGIQIRERLNEVYGNQCNVFFNVADDNTKIEVAYDVGDPDGTYADFTSLFPNQTLQFRTPGNDVFEFIVGTPDMNTAEELLVRNEGWDDEVKTNVYFFPLAATALTYVPESQFYQIANFGGICLREKKMIVIQWAGTMPILSILGTVAHEVGHGPLIGLYGLEHPRSHPEGTPQLGGFPLRTVEQDWMRLMSTAPAYNLLTLDPIPGRVHLETGEPGALMIKEEWDVIRGLKVPPTK